jgi:hypothetical protein
LSDRGARRTVACRVAEAAGFEDDRWLAASNAHEVQSMFVDVDERPGWREALGIARFGTSLQQGAGENQRHEDADGHEEPAAPSLHGPLRLEPVN